MANRFPLVFDAAGDKQIKELPTGDNLNLLGSSIVDVVNVNASGTIVADTLTVNNINASGGSIAAVAISNDYADLDNKPTLFSGDYNDLANLPIAGGNSWNDITNKPIIPSALSQLVNDTNFASENDFVINAANVAGLSAVGVSGQFSDLIGTPNFVTSSQIADGTLTIDVNNTGDLNGRLIADTSDRVAYDNTTDRFPDPKIDGEIQFIGAGNDALTKISASDARVVAEALGTRSLNLRAFNPLSSTWSDNGVNLSVNIDQAVFTQSRQLRIGDAGAGNGSRSVTILGEKYTLLGDDQTWTKLYLGGLSDAPEQIGGIIPAEKSHIFRFTKGYFEDFDTNDLIVNNNIELKGHIVSDDSTILIDTEQRHLRGSVLGDDDTILVDSANNTFNGSVAGDINRVGAALGITSDSGINLLPGGFLSIPNATTITAAATDTISVTATNTLTLASSSGKVKITGNGVPVTSIGVAGDELGMIGFDGSYIYYCTADHDSITNIWKRIAWSGDTW